MRTGSRSLVIGDRGSSPRGVLSIHSWIAARSSAHHRRLIIEATSIRNCSSWRVHRLWHHLHCPSVSYSEPRKSGKRLKLQHGMIVRQCLFRQAEHSAGCLHAMSGGTTVSACRRKKG